MTDNDLTAIRSRYLGVDKKKRKIRKMNDRKFVFDWDEQDDTFSAEAPAAVGSERQGAQIMFGRGHIAGMDDAGAVVPAKKNGEAGLQMADALERRKAAKTGLDERHWTEKPLSEMKERDWRILREDFSIAARGILYTLFKQLAADDTTQVDRSLTRYAPGPSPRYQNRFSRLLIRLVTRNLRPFNAKPSRLVFKTETSLE